MILYHGSPMGGLAELTPFLSEHGKPYIYFADNPLVALLYACRDVQDTEHAMSIFLQRHFPEVWEKTDKLPMQPTHHKNLLIE